MSEEQVERCRERGAGGAMSRVRSRWSDVESEEQVERCRERGAGGAMS